MLRMFQNISHSPSKRLALCASSFIVGCALVALAGSPSHRASYIFGAASALLIAACFFRKQKTALLLLLAGLFFVLGVWRTLVAFPVPAVFARGSHEYKGVALLDIQDGFQKDAVRLRMEDKKVISVFLPLGTVVFYGDEVVFSCALKQSLMRDLLRTGVVGSCAASQFRVVASSGGNWLMHLLTRSRRAVSSSVDRIFPEPQAGFLKGLLIGSTSSLSPKLKAAFKTTGTSHMVAVSGWNIGIVAACLQIVLRIFGLRRRARFGIAAIGILFFTGAVGASASVFRAAVMGILGLFATAMGRAKHAGIAVLVAAGFFLLVHPFAIAYDLGFLLSFAATLGLIYIEPLLEGFLKILPNILKLREVIATTLSATFATLPIVLTCFGGVSLVSLVVNALILPFLPLTMALGFVSAILGLVWLPLGICSARVATIFLNYCLGAVELTSRIPSASILVPHFNALAGVIMALSLVLVVWYFSKNKKEHAPL